MVCDMRDIADGCLGIGIEEDVVAMNVWVRGGKVGVEGRYVVLSRDGTLWDGMARSDKAENDPNLATRIVKPRVRINHINSTGPFTIHRP